MYKKTAIGSNELELLVDDRGLDRVIDMLADICHEKADHLRSAWQDDFTANLWSKAGIQLRGVVQSKNIFLVSK